MLSLVSSSSNKCCQYHRRHPINIVIMIIVIQSILSSWSSSSNQCCHYHHRPPINVDMVQRRVPLWLAERDAVCRSKWGHPGLPQAHDLTWRRSEQASGHDTHAPVSPLLSQPGRVQHGAGQYLFVFVLLWRKITECLYSESANHHV